MNKEGFPDTHLIDTSLYDSADSKGKEGTLRGGIDVAVLAALHLRPDACRELVLALSAAAPWHPRCICFCPLLPLGVSPSSCRPIMLLSPRPKVT